MVQHGFPEHPDSNRDALSGKNMLPRIKNTVNNDSQNVHTISEEKEKQYIIHNQIHNHVNMKRETDELYHSSLMNDTDEENMIILNRSGVAA